MASGSVVRILWELIVFHYVVTRNIGIIKKDLIIVPLVPVTLVISSVILITCLIYKSTIRLILWIYYGNKYRGFIGGCNVISLILADSIKSNTLHMALILKGPTNKNELEEMIKNRITQKLMKIEELSVELRLFMGYYFKLQSEEVKLSEVFETLNVGNDWLDKNYSSDLPRSNRFGWKIRLVSTPEQNIILFSMNHSLMDWFGLYNLCTNLFCVQDSKRKAFGEKISNSLRNRKRYTARLAFTPENPGQASDIIALVENAEGSITSLISENQTKYVEKIENIKKNHKGSTTTSIMLTALSASFAQYISENQNSVPDFVEFGSPVQINTERYEEFYNDTLVRKFENHYSAFFYRIPTIMDGKLIRESLLQRLDYIDRHLLEICDSFQFKFNYIGVAKYVPAFPAFLSKFVARLAHVTCGLSILPAGPKLTCITNEEVEGIQLFMEKMKYGIVAFIIIYDDRLHISLTNDKVLFNTREDLDGITQNFLEYLDILEKQIMGNV